jgi:hypothetical protein
MRRRKAWFKPYHARRSKGGSRRRSGESMGGALAGAVLFEAAIRHRFYPLGVRPGKPLFYFRPGG